MAKNIAGSVGQGGTNVSQSVMTIQYLLNCVPAVQGGPATELAVDGLVGPKTLAAILKFQKARFSSADGRVDANGSTLKALQQFDPYPQIPYPTAGLPGSSGQKGPYKVAVKFPGSGGSDAGWDGVKSFGGQKTKS